MPERDFALVTGGWKVLPSDLWVPDTAQKFRDADFEVVTPEMPNRGKPNRDAGLAVFAETIGERRGITLVAHSCWVRGAAHFIVENPGVVRNFVAIAGYLGSDLEGIRPIWQPFYSLPLDLGLLKKSASNFFGLYSKSDPMIPYAQADVFEQHLGQVFRFEDEGHFSDPNKLVLPIDVARLIRSI